MLLNSFRVVENHGYTAFYFLRSNGIYTYFSCMVLSVMDYRMNDLHYCKNSDVKNYILLYYTLHKQQTICTCKISSAVVPRISLLQEQQVATM